MFAEKRKILLSLLLLSISVFSGCDNSLLAQKTPGEVARVNGSPITLKQLNAMRDSMLTSQGGEQMLALEAVRQSYGRQLANLIVQELVIQQLGKKNMGVTPEELAAEEALVRADYNQEDFERFLLEESIDLETWREMLLRRVSMNKFLATQIRPQVEITPEEAEHYYIIHQSEFELPERYGFMRFSGAGKDGVGGAAKRYQQIFSVTDVRENYPEVQLHTVRMAKERLAPEFISALEKLKVGQISPVFAYGGEYVVLLLTSREAGTLMNRAEAFPLIENMLLEEKMQGVFSEWLEKTLSKADISVSAHLITKNPADQPVSQP